MPHRHRSHRHHRTSHSAHVAQSKSHAATAATQVVSRAGDPLHNLGLDAAPTIFFSVVFGAIIVVALIAIARERGDSVTAQRYEKKERERLGTAAYDLRKRAEVEEHVAESAVRMLTAREKVARASASMYGATTESYGARTRATESKLFFEAVSSNALPAAESPRLLPPVSSKSSGRSSGFASQREITGAALRAVIENGTDLRDHSVQSAWRGWEQKVRREHASPNASAIIEAAGALVQEAN